MRTIRKKRKFQKQKYDFRKKKRKFSFADYKKISLAILVSLILYFLFFSSFFQIKIIKTKGIRSIEGNIIEDFVNAEISKHTTLLLLKNNYFLVNEKDLEKRLLLEFSEIESIKIKKILPETLGVEIIEKTPLITWCRLDQCYYLDSNGFAFTEEEANLKTSNNETFIKITEQLEIEEEVIENKKNEQEDIDKEKKYFQDEEGKWEIKKDEDGREYYENTTDSGETTKIYLELEAIEPEEKAILTQITLNEKVSDKDFINFALNLSLEMQQIKDFKIIFFKTKGTKTRQLIAYTDKNIRIYFNTLDSAKLQVEYLKEFLSKAMRENQINSLEYVYLESGNKIFYK